jgi:hypothetical protein
MKKFILIFITAAFAISLFGCTENEPPVSVYTEYAVYYYLEDSTEQLAKVKVVTGLAVDTQITEKAIPITDYTVVGSEEQHLTLVATDNTITFYYRQDITANQTENGQKVDNTSVTTDEIDNFFDMTKDEVLKFLGEKYTIIRVGAEGAYEGYYYKEHDLAFSFWPDNTLASIFAFENFNVNGAYAGMNFALIQEHLGESTINEIWIEDPVHTAYEIEYVIGKCKYFFYSWNFDGSNSQLNITLND